MNIGDFIESKEGFFFISKDVTPERIIFKKGFSKITQVGLGIVRTDANDIQEQSGHKIGDVFKKDGYSYVVTEFPVRGKMCGHNINPQNGDPFTIVITIPILPSVGDFVESEEGFFFIRSIINDRIIPAPNGICKRERTCIDETNIDSISIRSYATATQKQAGYRIGDTFTEGKYDYVITEFPYDQMVIAHSINHDFPILRSIEEIKK